MGTTDGRRRSNHGAAADEIVRDTVADQIDCQVRNRSDNDEKWRSSAFVAHRRRRETRIAIESRRRQRSREIEFENGRRCEQRQVAFENGQHRQIDRAAIEEGLIRLNVIRMIKMCCDAFFELMYDL